MAIKNARKVDTKKRAHANANANASSSVAMAEMPPHGANHVQPPPPLPPLPPGVYFSPSQEDCLGFLNRRIAGDTELRDARGHIRHADVYGESPDALLQRHPPASIRDRERTWWFLSQTRFKSQVAGGGASKRADRSVEGGGYWRLEQNKEKLDDDGFKKTFGFYVGPDKRRDKTPWIMKELTSANDDGAGKRGVPALYKVYVTPRATDNQLREIFGEDGVKHEPDGNKKPARIMVPEEYFNSIAALLPQGSVRGGAGQEHVQAPPPPPLSPVAPEGLLDDFYSQQEQNLGQYYEQQQGQYLGQCIEQQEQYLGQCYEQQQEQYLGQCYEQQQEQYLGQYYQQQQQEPLSVIAPPIPPPASPGLLAELAADAPSENLSMPMAEFLSMLDDNDQPVETVQGEEPN